MLLNSLILSALLLVPDGKVHEVGKDEIKIATANDSIVELEFSANGKLEEASGDDCHRDILIPKNGLLTLAEANQALEKQGKEVQGEWSLEESFFQGWHYDFEGTENGKEVEFVVDAKNGKLLKIKVDD